MIGLCSFSKRSLNVWPQFGFLPVFESTVLLKFSRLQYFSLALSKQSLNVWPQFGFRLENPVKICKISVFSLAHFASFTIGSLMRL